MKTYRCGALALALVLSASVVRAEEPKTKGLPWQTGLYQGFQQACREKKLLVVYFMQEQCESCKGRCKHCAAMDVSLRSERLAFLEDRGVFVWQDCNKDDNHQNVAHVIKDLGIDRLPTVVVIDVSDRELPVEVGRIQGYFPAEKVVDQLTRLINRGILGTARQPADNQKVAPSPAPAPVTPA